jgi:hypothetical protein
MVTTGPDGKGAQYTEPSPTAGRLKKHTAAVKEAKSAAEPSMEDLEAQVEAHLEAQAEIAMGK